MEHNKFTSVEPINTSLSKFGVNYENQFVVLDDGKHVIGVDGSDGSKMILENVENGSNVKFEGSNSSFNNITNLFYDEDTGFLYSGDRNGHLSKYKIDTTTKNCQKVREYRNLRIGWINSSHRFLNFVFFVGDESKIRVLDLSTGELLPGCLETAIKCICSLQVCVKSHDQIYLAVSGGLSDYSDDKTDLFDVSGLLPNDPVVIQKFLTEYSIDQIETFLEQKIIIKSQAETIQKLTNKYKNYEAKFTNIQSIYDHLHKHNKELIEEYKKLKKESETKYQRFSRKINILYQQKRKTSIIRAFGKIIKNGLFYENDPLVTMTNLMRDLKEKEKIIKKKKNTIYDIICCFKETEEEARRLRVNLHATETKMLQMDEVIRQR